MVVSCKESGEDSTGSPRMREEKNATRRFGISRAGMRSGTNRAPLHLNVPFDRIDRPHPEARHHR